MKLSHFFFPTAVLLHFASMPITPEELEKHKDAFISFLNPHSAQMELASPEQIFEGAQKLGYSQQEAYGALVAHPFFKSNYGSSVRKDLAQKNVAEDITHLIKRYSTEIRIQFKNEPFEFKLRKFNEIVLHEFTCTKLGYDPATTPISDLAQAVKDGKVNQEAYQHAMICTQFARYYLIKASEAASAKK